MNHCVDSSLKADEKKQKGGGWGEGVRESRKVGWRWMRR